MPPKGYLTPDEIRNGIEEEKSLNGTLEILSKIKPDEVLSSDSEQTQHYIRKYQGLLNDLIVLRKGYFLRASQAIMDKQLSQMKQILVILQGASPYLIYLDEQKQKLLNQLFGEILVLAPGDKLKYPESQFDELIINLNESTLSSSGVNHITNMATTLKKRRYDKTRNIENILKTFDREDIRDFDHEISVKQQLVQLATLDALIGANGENYEELVDSIREMVKDPKQLIQVIKSLTPKAPSVDVKTINNFEATSGPLLIQTNVSSN
ncbi:MAG: hypothetical protein IPM51_11800 [Sphingobacteriaceae bacterium]|nr:hypothetical protein [Sphingobacteriaceae bacterium]